MFRHKTSLNLPTVSFNLYRTPLLVGPIGRQHLAVCMKANHVTVTVLHFVQLINSFFHSFNSKMAFSVVIHGVVKKSDSNQRDQMMLCGPPPSRIPYRVLSSLQHHIQALSFLMMCHKCLRSCFQGVSPVFTLPLAFSLSQGTPSSCSQPPDSTSPDLFRVKSERV